MHDEPPARTLKPDIPVVPPAVEITALLMFGDKGRQGVEDFRHGARRLSQPREMCKARYFPFGPRGSALLLRTISLARTQSY